ncbi:MAG TPA: aldo/keto reductase [Steroidobacteraceae bacterium]|jgi:aryl-alcohol dehydrogenase-like predicted oxidoreductase|nr:aldo/keto reductase [Steroidobacteraceae bacterium]
MRYRLLGQTGLYVSELCLGTMTYGGNTGIWETIGNLQQDAVNEQVKFAVEAGINFIDTANVYATGKSELLLGASLKMLGLKREQLIVATKATGSMDDSPNGRGQSRHHLFNQVDASLKRLQLDYIDLYQLHGFDPLTPFEESLSALNDLVRSGKVRYIGLCNMAAWQVMKSLSVSERLNLAKFVSVQAYYTVAGRDLERELVPLIQDQKLGLMVWSPLAGGLLSGKFSSAEDKGPAGARRATFDFPVVDKGRAFRCVDAMRPMALARKVSVAQIALAWLLAKSFVTTVIIGAKSMDQLRDNIDSTRVRLDDVEIKQLDEISALPVEYPGWMLAFQGQARAKPPVKE